MIDEFLISAHAFYSWTEELMSAKYFHPVEIARFLSHPEAITAWEKRSKDPEYANYLSNKRYEAFDRLEKPYGILTGGYMLDTQKWLNEIRNFLNEHEFLSEGELGIDDSTDEYDAIIYATGAVGPVVSSGLIPNKGEALIVSMPEWKFPAIIKEDVFFVPMTEEHLFWVGSYYEPWPENANTTTEGKQLLIQAIQKVYQGPFEIQQHLSGIRPTMNDRRPLVGRLPGYIGKYIFNGMGTKGTSLAPYWAEHLIDHLEFDNPINKLVDPKRYKNQQSG